MKGLFYERAPGRGRVGIEWWLNYSWWGHLACVQIAGFKPYQKCGEAYCIFGFYFGLPK